MSEVKKLSVKATKQQVVEWLKRFLDTREFSHDMAVKWENGAFGNARALYDYQKDDLLGFFGPAGAAVHSALHATAHSQLENRLAALVAQLEGVDLNAFTTHSKMLESPQHSLDVECNTPCNLKEFSDVLRETVRSQLYHIFEVDSADIGEHHISPGDVDVVSLLKPQYPSLEEAPGEFDVHLTFITPPAWKLREQTNQLDCNLRPFGVASFERAMWSLGHQKVSPKHVAFEAASSKRELLSKKVDQLELLLAQAVVLFHPGAPPDLHGTKRADWFAREVRRTVAFAGWGVLGDWSISIGKKVRQKIYQRGGYAYPCLWALMEHGRLLFCSVKEDFTEKEVAHPVK
ncbi:hypothetical protein BC832DRAFT_244636 [Gaertneriomyces semiglobifer]|nr:hypothetical protein BC832DRAFT_244636 [Gaertneriomyces semiglobifer]